MENCEAPNVKVLKIPLFNYDTTFRTKEVIAKIEQDLLEHGLESLIL